MTDTFLFVMGLSVFGLMLVGMIFTVMEFRSIGSRAKHRSSDDKHHSTADSR